VGKVYLTYLQYTALGYNAIPEAEFPRWSRKAEQEARLHTFNRLADEDLTDTNRAGVCEIADAFFTANKVLPFNESGQVVTSFTNQKYSETYAAPGESRDLFDTMIWGFMLTYFTAEQLYRGVVC
jgi:hypothetical protein